MKRTIKVWVFNSKRSRQGFHFPVGKKWPAKTMRALGYVLATLSHPKPRRGKK